MKTQDFIEEAKKIKLHLLIIASIGVLLILIIILSSGGKKKITKKRNPVINKKIKRIITDNSINILNRNKHSFMVLEKFFMKKSGKNSYYITKKSYSLKESDLNKKIIPLTNNSKYLTNHGKDVGASSFKMETQSIFKTKKKRSYNKKNYD